jgi:hypothetical protein
MITLKVSLSRPSTSNLIFVDQGIEDFFAY